MPTGRSNSLVCRLAEHLVCAELARRDLLATTFSNNIPVFDLLVADDLCQAVPLQVKATMLDSWRTSADRWMDISFDEKNETQTILRDKQLPMPGLIWVCVAVAKDRNNDRFFVLTASDIQSIYVCNHRTLLERYKGHRPRNWRSLDCWCDVADLGRYKDNWDIIKQRIKQGGDDRTSING